jgi:hypothetical protein
MAEVTLVKEQLTSGMIDAGAALLRKLDDVGMAPTAAFWLFDAEINEWRLVLASPEVATLGPLAVYLKIGTAIRELPPTPTSVSLSSVVVMESDAELVRLLTVGLEREALMMASRASARVTRTIVAPPAGDLPGLGLS